jgi:hypothetical protein
MGTAHVSAFADEIRNHPVLLALLNGLELQGQQLGAAQAAADQHRDHCLVPELARGRRRDAFEKPPALLRCQPVSQPDANAPHARDPTNTGCQFGAQKTRVGGSYAMRRTAANRRLIVAGASPRCSR